MPIGGEIEKAAVPMVGKMAGALANCWHGRACLVCFQHYKVHQITINPQEWVDGVSVVPCRETAAWLGLFHGLPLNCSVAKPLELVHKCLDVGKNICRTAACSCPKMQLC